MLKITTHRDADSERVLLKLEGRLAGPWVVELESCWRQMTVNPQSRTVIDLTGVTFVDSVGKALLTQMSQQGAHLHAAGCLNSCIVDEITKGCRTGSSRPSRRWKRKGS